MQITFLGSGTSTGVPVIGKRSPVNLSQDPKDKRSRSSILVENGVTIVVDTGPDFRAQFLNNNIENLDGVLYTHHHFDHLGGLDDLRPLTFSLEHGLPAYCQQQTFDYIKKKYEYLDAKSAYSRRPKIQFNVFKANEDGILKHFTLGDMHIQPIELEHDNTTGVTSIGYIFDSKFAYITDFIKVNAKYTKFLQNLEVVCLGAPLLQPVKNHISIPDATSLINKWNAKKGLITHLSDQMFHVDLENELPHHISPAYDGLVINLP